MEIYRVAFIGHRYTENDREIEKELEEILLKLLRSHEYVEFQLGRNGDFDILAASCIRRVRKAFGGESSTMTLVLPYRVKDMADFEKYYDAIFIPEEAAKSHPKASITKRNKWLAENSDLLIAYVHRENGGAYTCLKMAEKAGIEIIRI